MTVSPDQWPDPDLRESDHGDLTPASVERQISPVYPQKTILNGVSRATAEPPVPRDERHGLFSLADRILTSWGHTARVLAVMSVLLILLILGIGLLQITVDVGPLHITGNSERTR